MKPKLVIFDVNETLLDLSSLRSLIGGELGGRSDLLPLWFSTTLHYSVVETVSGSYRSFAEIGAAALVMIARREGMSLDLQDVTESLGKALSQLPPHADVRPCLQALQRAGFQMVSLTNSSQLGVEAQLAHAGLSHFFAKAYSVDSVRKFKPHPDTYRYVLSDWKLEPREALMAASHAWDLVGAGAIGLQTAFIARRNCFLYPNARGPSIVVNDLIELAKRLED